MTTMELKPCVLCGGEGVFGYVEDEGSPDFGGHFIQCTEMRCGMSVGLIYNNGEDPRPLLAERWNRRAPTPTPEGEREAIARIIEPRAWEKGVGFKWRYRDAEAVQQVALSKADQILARRVG